MGREATCHCKWGAEEGDCKVLLEGRELILRSGIRRRVSQSELQHCFRGRTYTSPLWVVYPKGAKSEVKESGVRDLLRSRGFIDTKVASVSARLTALRFVKRKSNSEA
jgi:hypothetical protein